MKDNILFHCMLSPVDLSVSSQDLDYYYVKVKYGFVMHLFHKACTRLKTLHVNAYDFLEIYILQNEHVQWSSM